MKSGSVEAFQVVVVCQDTPPWRRIRRSVSWLSSATMPLGEQVLAQLGQRPGGERGDAPAGGGRPSDSTDPGADLVTDLRYGTGFSARSLPGQPGYVTDIAWAPDGRLVATASPDIVRVFDAVGGDVIEQFLTRDAYEPNLVWAPIDRVLASSEGHILT
jgi:hypothetical protein